MLFEKICTKILDVMEYIVLFYDYTHTHTHTHTHTRNTCVIVK